MSGADRRAPSLRDLYDHARDRLISASIEAADLDARVLVCAAAGIDHAGFVAHGTSLPDGGVQTRLAALLDRRVAREPVSRILGRREFWSLEFEVTPSTLDPRPDSETLIEAVLELARAHDWGGRALRILDLGTGSGCLLTALLKELPEASGAGIDLSEAALRTARRNAAAHGVAGRAAFACADWMGPLSGRFDLIVSNPPYIRAGDIVGLEPEVSGHDPVLALDGGADGLGAYRDIAGPARDLLGPQGWIVLEMGAGQSDDVMRILRAARYRTGEPLCGVVRDLGAVERCVRATV